MSPFTPEDLLDPPVFQLMALCLGLIVGSFCNVVIHRLPLGQSVVTPRSRCPHCGHLIGALDNVPLLSWALLRGRCRACRAPISVRYPAVEAANGALWLLAALVFGPSPAVAVALPFVTAMLVLGVIDLEHFILPNVITLPGIALGVLASFLPGPPTPFDSVASAAGGYLGCAALAKGWEAARHEEALGQGDWKMIAMLGAVLGWERMLLAVFLATLAGAIVGLGLMAWAGRDLKARIPLGTFLALGGLAALLAGDPTLGWYHGLFRAR